MDSIQSCKYGSFYYAFTWHELFGFVWDRKRIKSYDQRGYSEANSEAIATCHNKARILINTLPLIKA